MGSNDRVGTKHGLRKDRRNKLYGPKTAWEHAKISTDIVTS